MYKYSISYLESFPKCGLKTDGLKIHVVLNTGGLKFKGYVLQGPL
jgi:hypothetical protein